MNERVDIKLYTLTDNTNLFVNSSIKTNLPVNLSTKNEPPVNPLTRQLVNSLTKGWF